MKRKKNFFLFYYIGGRYYDPASAICLDAAGAESALLNAATLGGLDRNGIGFNPMWLSIYSYTLFCAMGMLAEDPSVWKPGPSWWARNFGWVMNILRLIVGTVFLFIPGLHGIGMFLIAGGLMGIAGQIFGNRIAGGIGSMLNGYGALSVASILFSCHPIFAVVLWLIGASTMIMGANEVTYGITGRNYIQSWTGMSDDAYNATYIGLNIAASIGALIGSTMNTCFAEGTPVLTEEGSKPIEEIEPGDKVWAYNEETGEKALKEVVRVFRNSTLTTNTHYFEGEKEPIVCTPEHPFYILNTTTETPIVRFEGREESRYDGQWVQSKYLKVGDQVLLSDGKTVILTKTETEHLSEPITTYNFEVADFHTYYVGEQGILVHNACPVGPELPNEGIPNSSALRKDVNGQIYSAKTYGADGRVVARIDLQGTPHFAPEVGAKIIPHVHSPVTWVNGIPKDPKYAITLATYIGGL